MRISDWSSDVCSSDLSAATGLTNVLSGGTLGGSGTIGGSVTVADGGRLAPGNSPGTLTINGDLTLNGASILDLEFGQANVVGGPLNDLIDVQGNLTLDGTVDVTVTTGGSFDRSEEHTSELQSLMRISYAVFCLKKKKQKQ